jgi:hypothetical protein
MALAVERKVGIVKFHGSPVTALPKFRSLCFRNGSYLTERFKVRRITIRVAACSCWSLAARSLLDYLEAKRIGY